MNSKAPSLRECIDDLTRQFSAAGISTSRLDAELLCMHILKLSRSEICLRFDAAITEEERREIDRLAERRCQRVPLQYLVGESAFWSEDFLVTSDVLIPRPETEILLEKVFDHYKARNHPRLIADLGTGSGILAILLAKTYPESRVFGMDISEAALAVAARNSERHGVSDRVMLRQGDLWDALRDRSMRFDLIVANLPYIPSSELDHLQPEVKCEPKSALDGGRTGLDMVRRAVVELPHFVKSGTFVAFELGEEQGEKISSLFQELSIFRNIAIYRDYSDKERIITAEAS